MAPNDSSSRPYPEYQAINGFMTQGVSSYNALHTQIEHRFSNGLMFNVNYTWSHMLDNQDSSGRGSLQGTTIWQNTYAPKANYGSSNFDVRNMFKAYQTSRTNRSFFFRACQFQSPNLICRDKCTFRR